MLQTEISEQERATLALEHDQDEDCAPYLDADDMCEICRVWHGDPCPVCGGRGYHRNRCATLDAEGWA